MNSPTDFLIKKTSTIQPICSIEKIVPFGVEVVFRDENPVSKVRSVGWSIKALTFEPYSDALRGLDPNTGRVKITCNYFQLISEVSVDIKKDHSLLPGSPIESPCQPVTFTLPKIWKSHTSHPNQVPHHADLPHNNGSPSSETSHSVRQSEQYNHVPFYDTAPINISLEQKKWQKDMKLEYDSSINHNKGDLVTWTPNGTQVIGVMLCLTEKQNERGEINQ
ncbi:hypothetical protein O181_021197 [Austropuccinia psidii MF-1]|uniref:Uncharacterized protein n=1 Tax=Austropuccinia psidii MF-1 TaxID=1389203 RepID=A0A9Q3GW13_9BASI|nr:hypothetical protein [Austropuccinia psidii MF-1]